VTTLSFEMKDEDRERTVASAKTATLEKLDKLLASGDLPAESALQVRPTGRPREWRTADLILCTFCSQGGSQSALENEAAMAYPYDFPATEGHTLVVPKRHVATLSDLPENERAALEKLVKEVQGRLTDKLRPDWFSVDRIEGAASGQTVAHAHVHVIPHRDGDLKTSGAASAEPDRAARPTGPGAPDDVEQPHP
jgi:diadenosine tetraphosphate (Ap4A) HIT family hydrolase